MRSALLIRLFFVSANGFQNLFGNFKVEMAYLSYGVGIVSRVGKHRVIS